MRRRSIVLAATLAALIVPAAAHAAGNAVSGVVVAKQMQRGTFVVVARDGVARTVRGKLALAHVGARVRVVGSPLADATLEATSVKVLGRARTATVRGAVVRRLAGRTLVSAGGSVITIRRRISARTLASRGLSPGSVVRFGVAISGSGLRETSETALGTTPTVEVEGTVVTLSPFVVNVEGLPITIAVPAGVSLPATLAVGDEVGLTVSVDANNVLTLVSVDSAEAGDQGDQGDEQGAQLAANGNDQGQDQEAQGDDDRSRPGNPTSPSSEDGGPGPGGGSGDSGGDDGGGSGSGGGGGD